MKTSERHHLKEDDFQIALSRARDRVAERGRPIGLLIGLVVLVIALVGGYTWWQRSTNEKAAALLAEAIVTSAAPVIPAETTPPAPGTPAPPKPALSFATEQARAEAAIVKFNAAAQAYPGTQAGIAASYRAAGLLAEQGRSTEAETRFNDVIQRDGDGLYGRMARLGVATLQIQTKKYDQAIAALQTLSQRTDGDVPVDAVLMQLGDAYHRAGRTPEAVRTFTRVVDEFPQSPYSADARRRLDDLKSPASARS